MSVPSEVARKAAKGFSLNKMGGRSRYKEYDEFELAKLLDAFAADRVQEQIEKDAKLVETFVATKYIAAAVRAQ